MPNTAQQHRPPSRKATLPSVLPGKRIYINECPDKETRIKEIFDRRPPSRARTLTIAPSGKRAPINEPHNMADSISKTINRGPSLSIRTQTLQRGVFELDIPQCTSPEKRWACTGDCEPMEKRVADVVRPFILLLALELDFCADFFGVVQGRSSCMGESRRWITDPGDDWISLITILFTDLSQLLGADQSLR